MRLISDFDSLRTGSLPGDPSRGPATDAFDCGAHSAMLGGMLLLPLLFALAAADEVAADDVAEPQKARTLVLVLNATGDLEPSALSNLTSVVLNRLRRFPPLEVISESNSDKLLSDEKRAQLGTIDGVVGAASALGGLVTVTTAGKVGGSTVFTLELFDSTGSIVQRGSAQVSGLDDLHTTVTRVVDDVGRGLTGAEPGSAAAASSSTAPSASVSPPTPSLRTPVLVWGGAAVGVGALSMVLGLIPALVADGAEGDLKVLRTRYVKAGRDDAILTEAAHKHVVINDARTLWNDVGIFAFWGGFVVAAAGGATLAAAFFAGEAE